MYCPVCGNLNLLKFPNNRPAADFYCSNCQSQFEQKSKAGKLGRKINDGAYTTFIERISGNNNPDFFIMSYSLAKMQVENLYFIPKYFFTPEIVEKRNPLSPSARRAGWTGCNILFDKIPAQGKIPIVENNICIDKNIVLKRVTQAAKIRTDNIQKRGWLLDILNCINAVSSDNFSLSEIYAFEQTLAAKHPQNNNIKAKIRQQLQQLRDRGIITFNGNGHYSKIT